MKLEAVAFHEAGHAVIAWREEVKIKKVSIIPDTTRAGFVTYANPLRGIHLDIDGSDHGGRTNLTSSSRSVFAAIVGF